MNSLNRISALYIILIYNNLLWIISTWLPWQPLVSALALFFRQYVCISSQKLGLIIMLMDLSTSVFTLEFIITHYTYTSVSL